MDATSPTPPPLAPAGATAAATAAGLEGVIAADTALSDVDGARGRLIIAGRDVETLAATAGFEDGLAALWRAAGLPAADVGAALGAARSRPRRAWPRPATRSTPATAWTRCAPPSPTPVTGDLAADAVAVTGAVAVAAAAWLRRRAGAAPLAPDPMAGHAADYLRLATGAADAARARALDAYLVTVADHGMNASTFAARVVASTGSDVVSAVVAAIGALKGPLHGGAPGPVLDMLDAIGDPARADAWLRDELAAGRRIMGMGHRVYRVRDPRAAVLERALAALEAAVVTGGAAPATARLALARAVERAATALLRARRPDRPLCANVEFYTAVLLDAVGLPRQAFTPTFAVGRVAGWTAHVAEQVRTGRLIRPASRYVGPAVAIG
ncbi:MAG: citrate synthase [Kofleriaceae bacterium]|nr:citrate synthase [Kofleriaceae bacterium]